MCHSNVVKKLFYRWRCITIKSFELYYFCFHNFMVTLILKNSYNRLVLIINQLILYIKDVASICFNYSTTTGTFRHCTKCHKNHLGLRFVNKCYNVFIKIDQFTCARNAACIYEVTAWFLWLLIFDGHNTWGNSIVSYVMRCMLKVKKIGDYRWRPWLLTPSCSE